MEKKSNLNFRRRQPKIKSSRRNAGNPYLSLTWKVPSFPLPSRLRAPFAAEMFCYTASGAGTGNVTFLVGQYPFLPFNTSISGLTAVTNSFTTYKPIGFGLLANPIGSVYQWYRVFGSRIWVNVTPQSVTDSCVVAITPTTDASPSALGTILNQRMSVSGIMAANRPPPTPWGLTNSLRMSEWLGVDESAIRNDLSGNYSSICSGYPAYAMSWNIAISSDDASTFSAPVSVDVRMILDLELFNLTGAELAHT